MAPLYVDTGLEAMQQRHNLRLLDKCFRQWFTRRELSIRMRAVEADHAQRTSRISALLGQLSAAAPSETSLPRVAPTNGFPEATGAEVPPVEVQPPRLPTPSRKPGPEQCSPSTPPTPPPPPSSRHPITHTCANGTEPASSRRQIASAATAPSQTFLAASGMLGLSWRRTAASGQGWGVARARGSLSSRASCGNDDGDDEDVGMRSSQREPDVPAVQDSAAYTTEGALKAVAVAVEAAVAAAMIPEAEGMCADGDIAVAGPPQVCSRDGQDDPGTANVATCEAVADGTEAPYEAGSNVGKAASCSSASTSPSLASTTAAASADSSPRHAERAAIGQAQSPQGPAADLQGRSDHAPTAEGQDRADPEPMQTPEARPSSAGEEGSEGVERMTSEEETTPPLPGQGYETMPADERARAPPNQRASGRSSGHALRPARAAGTGRGAGGAGARSTGARVTGSGSSACGQRDVDGGANRAGEGGEGGEGDEDGGGVRLLPSQAVDPRYERLQLRAETRRTRRMELQQKYLDGQRAAQEAAQAEAQRVAAEEVQLRRERAARIKAAREANEAKRERAAYLQVCRTREPQSPSHRANMCTAFPCEGSPATTWETILTRANLPTDACSSAPPQARLQLATLHANRALLSSRGLRPWLAVVRAAHERLASATQQRRRALTRPVMAAWTLLARRRRGRDACVLGIGAIVSQRLHVRVAMRAGLLRLQRGIRREDRCVSAARRALSLRLLQRLWAGWGLCAQLTRERLEIEDYHRSVRAVSATPPSRIPPRAIALTAACHCTYRRAARRCCALCHHSSPTLYGRPCSHECAGGSCRQAQHGALHTATSV